MDVCGLGRGHEHGDAGVAGGQVGSRSLVSHFSSSSCPPSANT